MQFPEFSFHPVRGLHLLTAVWSAYTSVSWNGIINEINVKAMICIASADAAKRRGVVR